MAVRRAKVLRPNGLSGTPPPHLFEQEVLSLVVDAV